MSLKIIANNYNNYESFIKFLAGFFNIEVRRA